MSEYAEKLQEVLGLFEEFKTESEQGEEGRGSKGHALKARKLSSRIDKELKEFRRISIANDKG